MNELRDETAGDVLAYGLWRCLVLSGADISDYDGFDHWRPCAPADMADEAVRGVAELRAAYDKDGYSPAGPPELGHRVGNEMVFGAGSPFELRVPIKSEVTK